jgi:hypothetical protein
VERRIGIKAIPSNPKSYLNKQQQLGLIHLREYGWTTFCVRRNPGERSITILRNRHNRRLGILNEEGHLRLTENLKIRDARQEESSDVENIVASIRKSLDEERQEEATPQASS